MSVTAYSTNPKDFIVAGEMMAPGGNCALCYSPPTFPLLYLCSNGITASAQLTSLPCPNETPAIRSQNTQQQSKKKKANQPQMHI